MPDLPQVEKIRSLSRERRCQVAAQSALLTFLSFMLFPQHFAKCPLVRLFILTWTLDGAATNIAFRGFTQEVWRIVGFWWHFEWMDLLLNHFALDQHVPHSAANSPCSQPAPHSASPVQQVPGSTLLAKLPGSGWDSSYSGPPSGLVWTGIRKLDFLGKGFERMGKRHQGAMESLG